MELSNASDCETSSSKRVRFSLKSFTTRQILNWKKCNALDFEGKFFDMPVFEKEFASKKSRFDPF